MSRNTSDDAQHLHELTAEIEHLTQELAHLSTIVHHPEDTPSVFVQRKALQAQLHRAHEARDTRMGVFGDGLSPSSMTTDTEG